MTVTIDDPVNAGDGVWYVTWSTDLGAGTTFYIYMDGVLLYSTILTSGTFTVPPGTTEETSLVLEILDEPKDAPTSAWPMCATIAWLAVDDVDYYQIEEDVSGWTVRKKLAGGKDYYRWESRPLEDVTTHSFRVVAVGTNGNSSTVASLTIYAVHNPSKPHVSISYSDATRKVGRRNQDLSDRRILRWRRSE
jgi:hypothetical protein